MTSDGIVPSNEGRGYVLRRLLRRAARHGRLLGIKGKFLSELSKTVIEVSEDAYPELSEKKEYIFNKIDKEEESFNKTIDTGLAILKDYIERLRLQVRRFSQVTRRSSSMTPMDSLLISQRRSSRRRGSRLMRTDSPSA